MANEVDTTLLDNLNSIKNSKADIKQALINKGQSPTNILADYAQLIENIQTGEDLNDVLNIQDQKIAELEEALENKTAGEAKLNIYCQETEPSKKDGIWLQSNKTFDKVCVDTDIIADEEWLPASTYPSIPTSASQYGMNGNMIGDGDYIYMFFYADSNSKFNIKTGTFTTIASLAYVTADTVICKKDGFIYLFGGSAGGSSYQRASKYDIENNTFTTLRDIPFKFYLGGGAIVGDNIYLFGGNLDTTAYSYNIETNTYTKLPNIPYSFKNGRCVAIDEKIYLIGSSGMANAFYVYDTQTSSYSALTSLPIDITNEGAVTYNNTIYIIGNSFSGDTNKRCFKYNTISKTFTEIQSCFNNLSTPRVAITDDKIFAIPSSSSSIYAMNLLVKEYEDNSILISQGVGDYNTQLINAGTSGKLNYYFHDVWHYTRENGLDKTIPTYYGDGTQWIKFKN